MPQISDSFFEESSHSPLNCSTELSTENLQDQTTSVQWYKDNICSYYKSNLKISYLNINSVQSKFDEVKAMLNLALFDITFIIMPKRKSTTPVRIFSTIPTIAL